MTNIIKSDNPHIQARIVERIAVVQKSHSAYWLGDAAIDAMSVKLKEGSIEYLERLRKMQHGVSNFVKIVTGREIPVMYSSGEQSYTDGKKVVISASTDPGDMDSIVGTGLHEGAHCLLSTKALAFLPYMSANFNPTLVDLLPRIRINAVKLKMPITPVEKTEADKTAMKELTPDSVYETVQMVMNVLEDRRIDLWMYENAPGYRPYYEALYTRHWHSDEIDAALQAKEYKTSAVMNYALHVINLTNKHCDVNGMPGLVEIRKLANLSKRGLETRGDVDPRWKTYRAAISKKTATLDDMPVLFADAMRIVDIMLEHSTMYHDPNAPKKKKKPQIGGDLDNLDGGVPSIGELMDAIRKQMKFLKGDIDKKGVSSNTKADLDQMEATRAHVKDVPGDFIARDVKARVIIFREVTKKVMMSGRFPMAYGGRYGGNSSQNPLGLEAYRDGLRMGRMLAHRLTVLQDERPLVFTRQTSGRIDKRLVASFGYGNEAAFSHTMVDRKEPANIWIDVDLSGSMNGEKFKSAMTVAVAIAYAADKTRTLNCTVAVRDSGNDVAHLAILYDSRRHSFARLKENVPYLGCNGGTPEGLCFEAVKDEILSIGRNERKFFVNLSDGEPAHHFTYKGQSYAYGGDTARDHTRRLMREFRDAGIHVLSYYIGDDFGSGGEHTGFRNMYGKNAKFVNAEEVSKIANTLNALLIAE